METLVIFYSTVEARLGEDVFYFTGVGSNVDDAHKRAIQNMKDDEYLKCVHYEISRICYGVL
jgi:hypothetical protein